MKKYEVVILRLECTACKTTHALLPDIITPYSRYSLRFKLDAVIAYFNRTVSVEELCAQLKIAISTLYRWLEIFKDDKLLHLGVLPDQEITVLGFAVKLRSGSDLSGILRDFFAKSGFSFWQGKEKRQLPAKAPSYTYYHYDFP